MLASWKEFGQVQTIAISPSLVVLDGHQRLNVLLAAHGADYQVDARQASRELSEDEQKRLVITLHAGAVGSWDWDSLSSWSAPDLMEWGMDSEALQGWKRDVAALGNLIESEKPTTDAEPQVDRAAALLEKWKVTPGSLWRIGSHFLLCGDSTKREDVERVMGGEKAILCHSDPPYGMGKENEGIENDNLYRENLDVFQMQWWNACRPFLADNASVYIWGNAEDLWRLWYHKLKDSERLTFRNEITWDKGFGQGMGSDAHRMYPTASERCLFFVIGEQGWNNNADNYWEGFSPIVDYLESQRAAMDWSIKETKRIAGHSEKSGCHWFDKSQWMMPTEETYNAWRTAANGNAFRREYDELRREWYATRAPFDNSHSLMTDVWKFDTMRGDERPDHPTPKPPEMIARIIQTSGTNDAPMLDPFLGSGTSFVSSQNLGRKCIGIEKSPEFCSVVLERMNTAFPELEIERIE